MYGKIGNQMNDVTILIPIYNNSKEEILETLDSAFSQGSGSVMAYDDGSHDYVWETLESVSKGLLRRFKGKINKGMGFGMNYMLKRVETPYYIKLDCGDTYTSISSVSILRNHIGSGDVCYGNLVLTDTMWRYPDYSKSSPREMTESIIKRGGSGILPYDHSLHRTEFTIANRLFYKEDIKVGLDTYRFIQAINAGLKIRYVNTDFYYYNRNSNSISLNYELRQRDLPRIVELGKYYLTLNN